MPLYDFECPHGHRFEKNVSMAKRDQPIPCEGLVNRLLTDEELDEWRDAVERAKTDPAVVPAEIEWVPIDPSASNGTTTERVAVMKVQCILMAKKLSISFSESNGILDHGTASNRDAAREGRYDPFNPNRRFMTKGRTWKR